MQFLELEQLNQDDLPAALALYKTDPKQFRLHVHNTLHPNTVFQWHLVDFPPFRDAFPEHAKLFDDKLARLREDPECHFVETGGDSVLTRFESLLLVSPPLTPKEERAQGDLVRRIAANPKHQDVKLVLKGAGLRPRRVLNRDLELGPYDTTSLFSLPFGEFKVLYNDGALRVVKTGQDFYSVNERYYGK